jgi:WD40 repeat protein
MADIFVSYSRKDINFVRDLVSALETGERDVWVDWQDIPFSVDWWDEICHGIEAANTFVFVISPRSLVSPVCHLEIAHAREYNKRLVPILLDAADFPSTLELLTRQELDDNIRATLQGRRLDDLARETWHVLSRLNWVVFNDDTPFETQVDAMIADIAADWDHVRMHTRLLERALEWTRHAQDRSRLLRGNDLEVAETWLAAAAKKDPTASELHTQFIFASRAAGRRDQRRLLISVSLALTVMVVLAVLAVVFALISEDRRQEADQNAVTATHAQGLAEYNAATAIVERNQRATQQALAEQAQATSEYRANENYSLLQAQNAESVYESGDPLLALSLAIEANLVPAPPIPAQRVLADITYNSGLRRRFGSQSWIWNVDISPDGNMLLASTGRRLLLWDINTGEQIGDFGYDVGSVARFTPDGAAVITSACAEDDENTICDNVDWVTYDIKTGHEIRRYSGHTDTVHAVEFGPEGEIVLSGGEDKVVILWDIETGEELERFEGHSDAVRDVAISPDRTLAATSGCLSRLQNAANCQTIEIIIWDLTTGEELYRIEDEAWEANIDISSSSRYLVYPSTVNSVVIWDIRQKRILYRLEGHTDKARVAEFSPDERMVLSGSSDGVLILWDTFSGHMIRRFLGHPTMITSIAFSPDGQKAVSGSGAFSSGLGPLSSQDNTLILWDIHSGAIYHTQRVYNTVAIAPEHGVVVNRECVDFACENGRCSCVEEDLVVSRLTQAGSGTSEEIFRFTDHSGNVDAGAISPDGSLIASSACLAYDAAVCSEAELLVWDMQTGRVKYQLGEHTREINALTFDPDGGRVLAGDDAGDLSLWDISTGENIGNFQADDYISGVAISPDGQFGLSTADKFSIVFDLESGETIHQLKEHAVDVRSVAFSPDGDYVLTGGDDNTLILWETETGNEVRRLVGHSDSIRSIAFGPDGKTALSGSDDGTVFLWDLETGEIVRHFVDDPRRVSGVGFSPDGKLAFSWSAWKIIWWRLDTVDEMIAWAYANREVVESSCETRVTYKLEDECDSNGYYPTHTPFPTLPPQSLAYTPPLNTDARPWFDVNLPYEGRIGMNGGEIVYGQTVKGIYNIRIDEWVFWGEQGDVITILVESDASRDDLELEFVTRRGITLAGGRQSTTDTGSKTIVEAFTLPETGEYLILPSGSRDVIYSLTLSKVND